MSVLLDHAGKYHVKLISPFKVKLRTVKKISKEFVFIFLVVEEGPVTKCGVRRDNKLLQINGSDV